MLNQFHDVAGCLRMPLRRDSNGARSSQTMTQDIPEVEFRRFWQRLQSMGLNAYEARSYLVLVGHPRFKALELAARAHVPRQKIYEVLDGLVEKGFAEVVQERTKLFSAIPPDQAVPSYLAHRATSLQLELAD